jgi:hypothetical protein
MSFQCPTCARPLYNRRRKECEFCGAPIPASLQLTEAQKDRLDRIKADEARRRRDESSQSPGISYPVVDPFDFFMF